MRSAGKFYGAAGVRLGFAITSHPVAARLRAALGAWPIPAQGLAFGLAALADTAWAEAQRKRLGEAAAGLDALLTGAGLRVLGGTALFKLAAHPEAHSLFAHLAGKGILTRPFKDRAALRFGLPAGPEEMARLTPCSAKRAHKGEASRAEGSSVLLCHSFGLRTVKEGSEVQRKIGASQSRVSFHQVSRSDGSKPWN